MVLILKMVKSRHRALPRLVGVLSGHQKIVTSIPSQSTYLECVGSITSWDSGGKRFLPL